MPLLIIVMWLTVCYAHTDNNIRCSTTELNNMGTKPSKKPLGWEGNGRGGKGREGKGREGKGRHIAMNLVFFFLRIQVFEDLRLRYAF